MESKRKDTRNAGFAHGFYVSIAWIKCRSAYAKSKGHLCERCLERGLIIPGTQVHHKIRLTPDNLRDPKIALDWENLELLCDECHEREHKKQPKWRADADGYVSLDPPR